MSEFAPPHPSPLRQVRNQSSTSTSPDSTAIDLSDYDADAESVGVEQIERLVNELTLETDVETGDQSGGSNCRTATNSGQGSEQTSHSNDDHHQEVRPSNGPDLEPPHGELLSLPDGIEKETRRLKICHAIWKILLCGALFRAPVLRPRTVLSVSAGTSWWASEFGCRVLFGGDHQHRHGSGLAANAAKRDAVYARGRL